MRLVLVSCPVQVAGTERTQRRIQVATESSMCHTHGYHQHPPCPLHNRPARPPACRGISGGEAKRCNIGIALITGPRVGSLLGLVCCDNRQRGRVLLVLVAVSDSDSLLSPAQVLRVHKWHLHWWTVRGWCRC